MLALALAVLAQIAAPSFPFEIANNKTFVQVSIDHSEPLWFVFDTGNNGPTVIASECADRLKLPRGSEQKVAIGAGSGASVGHSTIEGAVTFAALGETLSIDHPDVLTLGHVARIEGRRVDGLIGADFISQHVVTIDYARGTMTLHDPASYAPPAGAIVIPLGLDLGWPVAGATIAVNGGAPLPCRLIVDTGMKGTVTLFRPFCESHGLYDLAGGRANLVTGAGAGGITTGDVARLDSMTLGTITLSRPVAGFARDRTGVMATDAVDGIMGGEILRRHRVTFDEPHRRMILEPVAGTEGPFEYDMSGMFLGTDDPDYTKIRVVAVNPKTPAEEAGLAKGDEIVSIDGQATPKLSLDRARALLRSPAVHTLEIRRGEEARSVKLTARRLV